MDGFLSFEGLLTISGVLGLIVLFFAESLLGFLNLLYITMECRRIEAAKQRPFRRIGVSMAIVFRALVLGVAAIFGSHVGESDAPISLAFFSAAPSGLSLFMIFGAISLIWIAMKEGLHLLSVDHLEYPEATGARAPKRALIALVGLNLLYALASVVIGITLSDTLPPIVLVVLVVGVLMIWLSEHAIRMIERHRALFVISLSLVFVLGIRALGMGFSMGNIYVGDFTMAVLTLPTFYFCAGVIVFIALAQKRYRAALMRSRDEAARIGVPTTEPSLKSR